MLRNNDWILLCAEGMTTKFSVAFRFVFSSMAYAASLFYKSRFPLF